MENNNTQATACFYNIRDLILNGELVPGEKLKGEYLKHKFNVGLSPIREALFRLIETGLVEFRNKIGFKVAMLTESKVYDIANTHAKLECLLLEESIKNGNDEWEGNIMAALYKLNKVETPDINISYSGWKLKNDEFHHALISACHMPTLIEIRNRCLQISNWYTTLANKNMELILGRNSNQEHEELAKTAIARQNDKALTMLHKHITNATGTLVAKLKTNGFIQSR